MATCCICENEHTIDDNDNSIHNKGKEEEGENKWIDR